MTRGTKRVLLLCGGVGGAKLAHGFEQLSAEVALSVVVNVGDDFEHLGLTICPDLDTVLYTLGGISNKAQGWGIEGESWRTLDRLDELGGETWFKLGDLDLATHLYRTSALASGESLSAVIERLAARLNIRARVVPATDDRLRTRVHTPSGVLDFQHYFVREQCEPVATGITFDGAESARLTPMLESLLKQETAPFDAVVLAPSNPFLSIAPILAVGGMQDFLRGAAPRVIAVSPIVAGKAVKGPAAKLMRELGEPVSAAGWAMYLRETYGDLVDEWILDAADADDARTLRERGFNARTTNTLMTGIDERKALATWLLDAID